MLVARPVIWGLALDGAAGVQAVLGHLLYGEIVEVVGEVLDVLPATLRLVLSLQQLHVVARLLLALDEVDDAVHAVADCDRTLGRGRVVGLAGESGSGKSTLAMAAIRLLRSPGVITGGHVLFHPKPTSAGEPAQTLDLLAAGEKELRAVRWSEISIVLQSALNALNPVSTIGMPLAKCNRGLSLSHP